MKKNTLIIVILVTAILIALGAVCLLSKPKVIKSRIDNQYHVVDRKPKGEWLPTLFPVIESCSRSDRYFDWTKNRSANYYMEKRGYKAPIIHHQRSYVTYKIKEKFYGFDAVELSIPYLDAIFIVKVKASPLELKREIKKITQKKIQYLSSPSMKHQDNVAFLQDSPTTGYTDYMCYIDDEFGIDD